MQMSPGTERFVVEPIPNGVQVSIPSRRNGFVILFLCLWLCGWFMGETTALLQLFGRHAKPGPPPAFLALWLTGWTAGGAFCLLTVLWQLAGREIIGVDMGHLVHQLQILGFRWRREYRGDQIRRLRAVDYTPGFNRQGSWMPPLIGQGVGPIAFDFGSRSVRIGQSLDEAEAPRILEMLSARLPSAAGTA